jgi:hypothetical protein
MSNNIELMPPLIRFLPPHRPLCGKLAQVFHLPQFSHQEIHAYYLDVGLLVAIQLALLDLCNRIAIATSTVAFAITSKILDILNHSNEFVTQFTCQRINNLIIL